MSLRNVHVDGVELVYEDWRADAPGRPFLLVHGFTGQRQDFADHRAALSDFGRTLVPDLRGHGGSGNLGDATAYTFDHVVADLRGLLDALDVERCDLLGHSMGGMVALRFALAHPERVASLVCMDTAARIPDEIPRDALDAAIRVAREVGMEKLQLLVQARIEQDPARPAADRALEERLGREAYWGRHVERFRAMDSEAYAGFARAILDQEPLGGEVRKIRAPALVMVGAEDQPFLAPADELEAALPDARRVTFEGAAHQPQLETPEAWIGEIRAHLERVRGTT